MKMTNISAESIFQVLIMLLPILISSAKLAYWTSNSLWFHDITQLLDRSRSTLNARISSSSALRNSSRVYASHSRHMRSSAQSTVHMDVNDKTQNLWQKYSIISFHKSDCHRTSSVIPLTTGDEVIKFGWLRGSVVERRSSAGVLSLSCARPVADG